MRMSITARLIELRASRAARALLEIHHTIDGAILVDGSCTADQLERLSIMRELAVMQLERLGARLRRNPTLRDAIAAACRAYREWTAHEPGSAAEQRGADSLSVRVLELRSTMGLEMRQADEVRADLALFSVQA
jgi:hypothetical protein